MYKSNDLKKYAQLVEVLKCSDKIKPEILMILFDLVAPTKDHIKTYEEFKQNKNEM